jgi:hypothetical protein
VNKKNRIPSSCRRKESGVEVSVCEKYGDPPSKDWEGENQQDSCEKHPPDKKWEVLPRSINPPEIDDCADKVDRASNGGSPCNVEPEDS